MDRFVVTEAGNMAAIHDTERTGANRVALFFGVPGRPTGAKWYADACARYLNHLDQQHKTKGGNDGDSEQV